MKSSLITRFSLLGVTLIILSGCASKHTPDNFSIHDGAPTSYKQVEDIHRWQAKGVLGVKTQNDAWSASFNWKQRGQQYYSLYLSGPIGVGSLKIVGSPHKAILTNNKNETFTAANAEELLEQQSGWTIPISNLYYWARGLAVPGLPAQKKLDQNKRLVSLSQQGWQISYLRYSTIRGLNLPNKIFLKNSALGVKMVINRWQIPGL